MNNIHFYELSFYHDEDDKLAVPEKRCSYCIKTEISPVIQDDIALSILFSDRSIPHSELRKNLTCVQEISEEEARMFFDVDGLTVRAACPYGVYYHRDFFNEERPDGERPDGERSDGERPVRLRDFLRVAGDLVNLYLVTLYVNGEKVSLDHPEDDIKPYLDCEVVSSEQDWDWGEVVAQYIHLERK